MTESVLDLRPAVIADAPVVADLETLLTPDDPRDSQMLAFWWTHHTSTERMHRLINTRDGVARMFLFAGHDAFVDGAPRFGRMRIRLHPDDWTAERHRACVRAAEEWLVEEGAEVAATYVRSDHQSELDAYLALGFVEERRSRMWRLDLEANRERLLETARGTRAAMERAGIELTALNRVDSPAVRRALHRLDVDTTRDIPKTVPEPEPTFDEWERWWFDNPGHRIDRQWLAREGEELLGVSLIGYPPERGIPWTSYTCTARSARGRGIARALKYATVEQAIELGVRAVGTSNDSENAPILHLNEEMGYEPFHTAIELHHAL